MSKTSGSILLRCLVVLLGILLSITVAHRNPDFLAKQYTASNVMQARSFISLFSDRSAEDPITLALQPKSYIESYKFVLPFLGDDVLAPVIAQQGYSGQDAELALARLRSAIAIKPVRGTELVQITVTAQAPTQAASLANAVTDRLRWSLIEVQNQEIKRRLAFLEEEIGKQREKVDRLRDAANQVRTEAGSVGPDPNTETEETYLREKDFLEKAEVTFAKEKTESAMPPSIAVIWERAEPPAFPTQRHSILLALVFLTGLLIGVALAFLPRPEITAGILLVLLIVAFSLWWTGARSSKVSPPHATLPFSPATAATDVEVKGKVLHPGPMVKSSGMTLLTAIRSAGGFAKSADQKKVTLSRAGRALVVDTTQIASNPSKDLRLEMGDVIEIPAIDPAAE